MSPTDVTITEVRFGRNFIRLGDIVRVKPSRKGKKDGFDARVSRLLTNEAGQLIEVEVVEPMGAFSGKSFGRLRSFRPDRIERKSQTKNGEPR